MNYEEHIDTLAGLLHEDQYIITPPCEKALRAAIELMRAADTKGEREMKEHIEALRTILGRSYSPEHDIDAALRAAIELMRATAPKDEKAEREHCAQVLQHMKFAVGPDDEEVDVYMADRAAARAEGAQKRYEQLMIGLDVKDARLGELETKLSAAQGEIRTLTNIDEARVNQLRAAQAEIERLHAALKNYSDELSALRTRLAE